MTNRSRTYPIRTETYAHGVAHVTDSSLNLPPGIPDGEPAIFLDCETLGSIADELKLDFEPVLGRTAIHELSHIVRGHVTSDGGRTHGFAREGDAQRDAWAVTGSMLTSPDTFATAFAGRAAQVRLADHQPRAYTMFGNDSADRYHWNREDPESTVHLVRTPRNLLAVIKEDIVEVPVRTLVSPVPEVGDRIYLAEEREDGDYFVAGPWVVLNRVHEAISLSKRDRDEVAKIERDRRRSYGARTDVQYVVLRPFRELRAARAVSTDDLPPIGIPYAVGEPGAWLDHLVRPAEPVFEQIRDERRAAHECVRGRCRRGLPRETAGVGIRLRSRCRLSRSDPRSMPLHDFADCAPLDAVNRGVFALQGSCFVLPTDSSSCAPASGSAHSSVE